jgi:hypothetical protein
VVLVELVVEGVVVVGEMVNTELLAVPLADTVVGVLSNVVGGTMEATVVGVVGDDPGRVGTAAATMVVVVLVLVVVLVGGVVRGGAVSVTVELPPPSTPTPVEPSPWPRVLVMTEPSGRIMMSPSAPPMGPAPGMAMVWMTVPFAFRTII